MNNEVTNFLRILRDNNYVANYDPIPEGMDIYPIEKEEIESEVLEEEVTFHDSLRYFMLNGFRSPYDLEDYLSNQFSDFKVALISDGSLKDKNFKTEIIEQVSIIKNYLYQLLESIKVLNDITFNELITWKIKYCEEVIKFVNSQVPVNVIKNVKVSGKLTSLKQKEIVILFHHLRELGLLGKEMTNKEYSHCISTLTGYDSEQIRQDLSHITSKSNSVEHYQFQATDYSGIKRALEQKLLKAIEEKTKEK
jgi:hypothetical protein